MAGGDETFTVEQPGRLDAALAARASVGSRKRARDLIARGKVSVAGAPAADAAHPVAAGARVVIAWNRPGTTAAVARGRQVVRDAGLRILHEDAHLVAVDKPPGLLTDAATARQRRDRDTVRKRLDTWLHAHGQRAWPCHRIDADTSGIVLFARDEATQRRVRDLFAAHVPERVYLAIVEGVPDGASGTFEDWMAWDPHRNRQLVATAHTDGAVFARAAWTVVQRAGPATLLEVRLHTGRRNQIRVHLQRRGIPLVGETQYLPEGFTPRLRARRQALHATRLSLPHPHGGTLTVTSPLPPDLARLLGRGAYGAGAP